MTQEEKAKAYDDALKVAVAAHKDEDKHLKATLERIFPELKGSEDDKIRKGIKSVLKHYKESGEIVCPYPFVSIDEALAWLEKQGEQKSAEWHKGDEQNLNACLGYIPDEYLRRWLMDVIHVKYDKPTDKVEPTFKVGYWVVRGNVKVQIIGIEDNKYCFNGYKVRCSTIDKCYHLWTIEDAKDGDVLYSPTYHLIWIYQNKFEYYASFNLNYVDSISSNGIIVIPSDVCPASKEQRDLLFQKIEETGYKWDAEKKKLKKIKKNDYEPDTLIEEFYQQQADDLIDMVTEKTAWSEEDEMFVHGLIRGLSAKRDIHGHTTFSSDCIDITETINWLKTLKDRVQPKQEWGEEDWNYIADLISYFDGSSLQHDTPDVISWLKSFKPQTTWKPSEEQMKAIRLARSFVVDDFGEHPTLSEILMELEEQLKKLKG